MKITSAAIEYSGNTKEVAGILGVKKGDFVVKKNK